MGRGGGKLPGSIPVVFSVEKAVGLWVGIKCRLVGLLFDACFWGRTKNGFNRSMIQRTREAGFVLYKINLNLYEQIPTIGSAICGGLRYSLQQLQ